MNILKPLIGAALLAAPMTALDARSIPASQYLTRAAANDLFERESAELMLSSGNPRVHHFAVMMITDHAKSAAELEHAATSAHLPFDAPRLSGLQAYDLAALRGAHGGARDHLYIRQQKAAHWGCTAIMRPPEAWLRCGRRRGGSCPSSGIMSRCSA
ncbi:MAG: hypothetical protein JWN66_349 [Sphingomonas bacterium]|uniref:DUF4142 domain-containing protein n=1 Tax=Sphingomonas bacterium TaxID=1895847 RepID=UPI0026179638|nr:DUF4142 domain-containing protein [Sphingomonas bacterium]MDB5703233.1 hypothetical protein [Sphingomonas bacterium]